LLNGCRDDRFWAILRDEGQLRTCGFVSQLPSILSPKTFPSGWARLNRQGLSLLITQWHYPIRSCQVLFIQCRAVYGSGGIYA
jgi:hypothetical protein